MGAPHPVFSLGMEEATVKCLSWETTVTRFCASQTLAPHPGWRSCWEALSVHMGPWVFSVGVWELQLCSGEAPHTEEDLLN